MLTLAVQADVAKLSDLDKLYTVVSEKLGRIDVLFVNAGIAKFAPLAEVDEAHYDEMFDINTKGAYFTIQKAIPHLNDGASVILNSSVVDELGSPNGSVYAATKAALRSLARSTAAALVDRGIRVNTVAPGPIETPIFGRTGLAPEAIEDFKKNEIRCPDRKDCVDRLTVPSLSDKLLASIDAVTNSVPVVNIRVAAITTKTITRDETNTRSSTLRVDSLRKTLSVRGDCSVSS